MKTNIILPIAGHGQRFVDGGYATPKPLIEVDGKYLVEKSLESVDTSNSNLIFIVREEHVVHFDIDNKLRDRFGDEIEIISIDYTTDGAICTCLLAQHLVNNDLPTVIFTPDCYFEPRFQPSQVDDKYDGVVCVFNSDSPAHSYVVLNDQGFVTKAAEKQVISNDAVGGLYYFRTGKMFVRYANDLVAMNLKSKGEFYICPVYNLLIEDGLSIGIDRNSRHEILGTPEGLEKYTQRQHK